MAFFTLRLSGSCEEILPTAVEAAQMALSRYAEIFPLPYRDSFSVLHVLFSTFTELLRDAL